MTWLSVALRYEHFPSFAFIQIMCHHEKNYRTNEQKNNEKNIFKIQFWMIDIMKIRCCCCPLQIWEDEKKRWPIWIVVEVSDHFDLTSGFSSYLDHYLSEVCKICHWQRIFLSLLAPDIINSNKRNQLNTPIRKYGSIRVFGYCIQYIFCFFFHKYLSHTKMGLLPSKSFLPFLYSLPMLAGKKTKEKIHYIFVIRTLCGKEIAFSLAHCLGVDVNNNDSEVVAVVERRS